MYDMDPDQERLAGCYDGMKAGKALTITEVRLELARFGLAIDKDLQIKEAVGRISRLPEPVEKPDNPHANPHYNEGFERGIVIGRKHARIRIRQALAAHDLFLCEDGAVTTIEFTSDLVSFARFEGNEDQVAPLRDDKAIHAFLDGTFSNSTEMAQAKTASQDALRSLSPHHPRQEPTDSNHSVESPIDTPSAHDGRLVLRTCIARRIATVKKALSQRALLATALGAVLTTITALGLPHQPEADSALRATEEESAPSHVQSPSTYVPPATWDQASSAIRERMLQWDRVFWTYEQSSAGAADLQNIVAAVMTAPTDMDDQKSQMVYMLTTSERDNYWEQVCLALNPANCNPDTTLGILRLVASRILESRASAIPPQVYQQLHTRYANCSEEEQRLATLLSYILTLGGIPH